MANTEPVSYTHLDVYKRQGSAGKPIQLLSLYAYRNDGTKLVTGVVVMYRAYVEGRWLPWVSNANPEWMRSVQATYSLDGTLDTSSN